MLRVRRFLSTSTKIFQQRNVVPYCNMESRESPVPSRQGHASLADCKSEETSATNDQDILGSPIGFIQSCFKSKNGTPRQPSVCAFSRAKLTVLKEVFPNPEHSIQGLGQFSHVWILFIFHKNGDRKFTKAKVKPPRLDGAKVGVFASRSPHRPNPIGLTLAKLDRIQGSTLHLSGVDIIDGTPVLDIKPYVPSYDNPDCIQHGRSSFINSGCVPDNSEATPKDELLRDSQGDTKEAVSTEGREVAGQNLSVCSQGSTKNRKRVVPNTQDRLNESAGSSVTSDGKAHRQISASANTGGERDNEYSQGSEVGVADWIHCPPIRTLDVRFTAHAEAELGKFKKESSDPNFQLEFLLDQQEAKQAICKILEADPRSTYRRNNCQDRLYFFTVDTLHVTCWFGSDFVEVVRVQPVSSADIP
ncbi:tRNA (adenine(37)-N6)-methyltransferase-like isoform X2 [Patiria miniata]|uniref:TsaA-like domain-containing protein n=1 Tax=Patiria miniata TaxID=46514 RepID=A0A914B634_PATMI|nr:tRNA (adenine(37)-N6)-methyltransferase-like isoform X2 [Patiria miniata]